MRPCSKCGQDTYPHDDRTPASRKRHCLSPTCTWCQACVAAKRKESGVTP